MKAREIVNERLKTMKNTSALELIVRIRLNELFKKDYVKLKKVLIKDFFYLKFLIYLKIKSNI